MYRKRKLAALALVCVTAAALITGCAGKEGIADLCGAIEAGRNEEAVKIAEEVGNLNSTSGSVFWELFEAEVTTPLVRACETGNREMIIWLLEHGARTDYAPGRILYPLEGFCDTGSGAGKEALQKLLECGADPEQYKQRPPLFRLAQTLNHRSDETYQDGVDMVLMVLDSGARWQDPTDGSTILHYAATQRNGEFLKALLERKEAADFLNTKNHKGQTPLDLAEQMENSECVKILTAAGAR